MEVNLEVMMNKQKQLAGGILIVLMILISGCSQAAQTPDLAATMAVNVAVAQTMGVVMTQSALTQSAFLAQNPTSTPTPQAANTSSVTSTPEKVTITLTRDAYCRKGIFSQSPSNTMFSAGQALEVIARDPTSQSYFVIDPNHTQQKCWVWGEFVTIEGAPEALPVFTSVPLPTNTPTPTPAPDFSVAYIQHDVCGTEHYFKFQIKNTGQLNWETLDITIKDVTSDVTTKHTSTIFEDYNACVSNGSQDDFTPGEGGYVVSFNPGQLTYDPTAHTINATFTLCQVDNYSGCISKSISFTP